MEKNSNAKNCDMKETMPSAGYDDDENRFTSYWDYSTEKTKPLILAFIPTENPWEIFAFLPFDDWNDCPDTPNLMAVSKYWYKTYHAAPAVVSHDTFEYILPVPIPKTEVIEAAVQQFRFCTDIVEQGVGNIGALAEHLRKSNI